MKTNDENFNSSDRRRHARWSVYNFMHATATLGDCPTGLLADISHEGAQVILPLGCEKQLNKDQDISMRIKTTLDNMDIPLKATVKSITAVNDNIRVGVEFKDIENHKAAKIAVYKICEYGKKLKSVNLTQSN